MILCRYVRTSAGRRHTKAFMPLGLYHKYNTSQVKPHDANEKAGQQLSNSVCTTEKAFNLASVHYAQKTTSRCDKVQDVCFTCLQETCREQIYVIASIRCFIILQPKNCRNVAYQPDDEGLGSSRAFSLWAPQRCFATSPCDLLIYWCAASLRSIPPCTTA